MAYVEWHDTVRNHPKTDALMLALNIPRREAVGIIGCLSSWAIQFRPGGIIEPEYIHVAVEWEKDPLKLLDALKKTKWLDEMGDRVAIHDWREITKNYRKAQKDAKRKKREYRQRIRGVSEENSGDSVENSRVAPRTERNREERKGEEQRGDTAAAVAARAVEVWNDGLPKNQRIRKTAKRVAKAATRLKEFQPVQLIEVVKRIRKSEFHMGGNDRQWRAPGPEWVWHTTERVEEWLNKNGSAPSKPSGVQSILQNIGEANDS